jgi:GTP-binding protein
MADIPGIIEGAAEGKGLGHYFLRHIERNATLLFLIPADSKDISQEYNILLDELRRYNPELLDKERLVAISKCDMLDKELIEEMDADMKEDFKDVPYTFISSVSGLGIQQLKDRLWKLLNE